MTLLDALKRAPAAAAELSVGAVATGLWLLFLDRVGLAVAGLPAWCGAAGILRVGSIHVLAALLVTILLLAARRLLRPLGGRAFHVALGLSSALLMLALAVLFSHSVRADAEIATQPFRLLPAIMVALFCGAVVTALACLRARRWYPVLLATASLLAGLVDATIYPGQVPDVHLGLYAMQGAAFAVGVALPVAAILRRRRLAGALACALVALALVGGGHASLRERGATAQVSVVVGRLLRVVPGIPHRAALRSALEGRSRRASPESRPTAPQLPKQDFSVLLVTVDALRADALLPVPVRGSYLRGGETPFLDAWLPTTTRFMNAYASGPMTLESMYTLLRGIGVADPAGGTDIPTLARSLDMASAAVIPWFFGANPEYGASVDAFDRVDLYNLDEQETQTVALKKTFDDLRGERSFVWTHFYCTHLPYCGDGRPLSHGLKSPFGVLALGGEYRQAVQWLDAQMARIVRMLEDSQRADQTIVVLASDHGEHLGEGLVMGHGDALHGLDLHVPLAIRVPGKPGGIVRAVASNSQILPTVLELLGEPPAPAQTAPSLVPVMFPPASRSSGFFHVRGVAARQRAVITQDHLLLYDDGVGAFSFLPREPGLLPGVASALSLDKADIARSVSRIVRGDPALFAGRVRDPRALELLRRRLLEVSQATDPEELDFLLRLAAHVKEPSLSPALFHAYEVTPSPERRVRTAALLEPLAGPFWVGVLGDLLVRSLETPAELPVLRALAAYRLSRVLSRPELISRARSLTGTSDAELVAAWLELMASAETGAWALPAVHHLARLTAPGGEATSLARRALVAVSALRLTREDRALDDATRLAAWIRTHLASEERATRRRAVDALGAVGASDDMARLAEVRDGDASTTVRRRARRALDRLAGVLWIAVPPEAGAKNGAP